MRKLLSIPRVQDWMNLVFGVALFVSPWALRFSDVHNAAWDAWACGATVSVVAVLALIALKPWEEWHGLAMGIWMIAAPWVLSFGSSVGATAAHMVFGITIMAAAAWEIWDFRRRGDDMAY